MKRKFRIILDLEIPDSVPEQWSDEYVLCGIDLVPQVSSFSFEGIKITTLDIKREDGTSVGGFPQDSKIQEYVFFDKSAYNMAMIDKERLNALQKNKDRVNGGLDESAVKPY